MRQLLLVTTLLLTSAAGAIEPVEHIYQARVHVTAEGNVEAVEPQEGMVAQVAAVVVEAARANTFTPATVNGVAAASKTSVWVKIRFEGVPGDSTGQKLAARVIDVSQTNPFVRPPRFPRQAMREGVDAKVWVELAVLPDGTVDAGKTRVVQADVRASNGRKLERSRNGAEIVRASLEAAREWKLFPEEVAGVAQPTRLVVPLTYCSGSRSPGIRGCPDFEAGPADEPRFALDPGIQLPRMTEPEV